MSETYEPVEGEPVDAEVVGEPAPGARSPAYPTADEVEIVTGRELAVRERGVLFRTDDPAEILEQATKVANQFKDLLRKQKMVKGISGREHVLLEGWQTVGIMLGLSAKVEWSRMVCHPVTGEPLFRDYQVYEKVTKRDGTTTERRFQVTGNDWEARVVAQRADGVEVAAGEGMVSRNESTWSKRDDFALRSMAQTRASSKALRAVLSWIVTMAGYSATPSEEVATEPETAMPAASDELVSLMTNALTWLLDDPARVQWVREEIQKMSGGFITAAAAQGVVLTAKAVKDQREQENDDPPNQPEEGTHDGAE